MKKLLLALLLASSSAFAQSGTPVKQNGNITPGHPVAWTTNGVVQDAGVAVAGFLTGLGVTAVGQGICQNSAPPTGPYNQICFTVGPSGGGFTFNNFGGATGGFSLLVNGTSQSFTTAVLPTTPTGQACFTNASGTIGNCTGGGGATLIVGGTTITSGTNGALLYNNAGTLGNLTTLPFIVSPATGGTGIANSGTITVGGALVTTGALTVTAGATNQLALWSSATALGGLATGNSGVLVTDGSGVPSIGTTLPFTVPVTTGGTGQTTFTANLPLFGNGGSALAQGTRSGNTTEVATFTGAATAGNCVSIDGNGNLIAAGGACTTGGGGGTVASSTIGQVPVYTAATTVTGNAAMTYTTGVLTLGTASTTIGKLILEGNTSGAVTIAPQAVAGTPTITWGTGTGTPVVTGTAPFTVNATTGNGSITGAAGQVSAGATGAFTATPVLGTAASAAGTLGLCNGSGGGACLTLQNLGAASAYNFNFPTTAGSANQLLTSQGGATTSETWQNLASLMTQGSGVTLSGTTNVTVACNTMTTAAAGCAKPDNASINVTAGVLSGPAFIFYPACTAGGVVDCSANINAALTSCATALGGQVILPPGVINVNTGIVTPANSGGCELRGAGTYQEYTGSFGSQTPPTNGTILYQTTTAACAISVASAINHVWIHDLTFQTNQPADTVGWTPTNFQPSICLNGGTGGQVNIDRISCYQVITCIAIGSTGNATGRTRISYVISTCFSICIDDRFSADFVSISHIECYPNLITGTHILAYIQANATCLRLIRADQPVLDDIEAFNMAAGVVLAHSADGDVSWLVATNIQCDQCNNGIYISGCAQGSFSNVHLNGSTTAGSVGVNVPGTGGCSQTPENAGANIIDIVNIQIQGPQAQCIAANVIDLSVTNLHCQAFNAGAGGAAGITMNAGATYTASGRQAINNLGNTGGGGGGATSGAGTFHGTIPF